MSSTPIDTAATTTPIPAPAGLPVVGNLLQLPRGRLTQHLMTLAPRFDGIFAIDFAGRRVPFITSAALAAEVSDERRFRKLIGPPLSMLRPLAGDGLFTAHGDEPNWGKAHRILLPAFSQRAMRGYFDAMLAVAQQLVDTWARSAGQDLNVADDMTRLTLDTIALCGFGYRFDSFAGARLHPFLEALVRVLDETMARLTRLPVMTRLMPARQIALEADIASMSALVDDVIRARRGQSQTNRDLMGLMLDAVDPESGQKLDDANIRFQVITFLIAGHETTSGLLTFTLYLLMRHPQVLAQAYAEVDRVLPGDTVPEYGHLAALDVIDRVLKEALRLWPTAPAFAVAPYEDTVIGGRYRLPANHRVSVLLPALHRDPAVWERPDEFDIDRFLPQNERRIPPHAYKPFGNGQRACIGRQFALTEAKLALALLLQRFSFSDPNDYALRIRETLTLKPDGFTLRARPRRPNERIPGPGGPASAPTPSADISIASSGAVARGSSAAPATLEQQTIHVLWGSSLGTTREIAERLATDARAAGAQADCRPLDALVDAPPVDGLAIVVAASYNGRAADGARAFEAHLDHDGLSAWRAPRLRYAVLGCGDSEWQTFQAFPRRVDAVFAAAGAQALIARGEADASGDFDAQVAAWTDRLWRALGAAPSSEAPAAPRVEVQHAPAVDTPLLAAGAQAFEVIGNDELVRDPAGLPDFGDEAPRGPTRRLRLRLPDGCTYRTGDHLALWPRNADARVRPLLARFGMDADTVVRIAGAAERWPHLPADRPLTAHRLLAHFVDLGRAATRADVERLRVHTRCPHTQARLDALTTADAAPPAALPSVADLVLAHPAIEIGFDGFLACCAPMRARLYSISSAPGTDPGTLALTVGSVSGPAWSGSGHFVGTTSAWVSTLAPGDVVAAAVRAPQPPFDPPASTAAPMILIAAGTGIAPFLGFVEELAVRRAATGAANPTMLFHGCRHPAHDRLCADALDAAHASGLIALHCAYSNQTGAPARFVQDAVWAQRAQVWAWLAQGATVYVCGDGRLMAPAVRDTLLRIHRDASGGTHAQASDWLAGLVRAQRYRQDVFN